MKKKIWGAVLIVAGIVFIAAAVLLVMMLYPTDSSKKYIHHQKQVTTVNKASNHDIDWDQIRKDNKDIYAWLYVPKTKVDYAVVQPTKKEGDLFYLNRNLKKNYEFAGSIFSEGMNSKDFSDPVTVLYGHNMLNGTMFATLHKFRKPGFFKKNKYMYIFQPHKKLTYKIYAAYEYDDRHIMNSFDFDKKKVRMKYFKSTLKPKAFAKNTRKVKLSEDSKVLTLSTCVSGNNSSKRYLVQGVLEKYEQTD